MEENNKKRQLQRAVVVFTLVVCLSAIAGGLGSATFSNYFKGCYQPSFNISFHSVFSEV